MGTGRCNFCTTKTDVKDLRRCSGCTIAYYCSKECQKQHWNISHKSTCHVEKAQLDRAAGDPVDKAQVRKLSRWTNVWCPVISGCLPIALDVANHQWGRPLTHTSLVITIEHTNLNKYARSYRVENAELQPYATILKEYPQLEPVLTNSPELSESPHFHCLFFVKDREDPTKMERRGVHSWHFPDLREVFSHLEKDYSRSIAKLAIPLLVSEINGFGEPDRAMRMLRSMIESPEAIQPFLKARNSDITGDDDDGELLSRYLERLPLLNRADQEN